MPNISVANPSSMAPVSFFLLPLQNMYSIMPTRASTGVNDVGFRSCTKKFSLSMPLRLRSHAVTVVPTLAPIITLMACFRSISPEFTNPTTITVVAEELCITDVTPRPVRKPVILLVVSLLSKVLRAEPARLSRASPMMFIPKRNRHSPPIRESASKISMFYPFNKIHMCKICYMVQYLLWRAFLTGG